MSSQFPCPAYAPSMTAANTTSPTTTPPSSPAPSPKSLPVGVVGGNGGGIEVDPAGKAGMPTLDVYVDFQCPVCGQFEKMFGPALTEMARTGAAKYIVHMMSFLDTNLGNDSSKRSANAAACAADAGKFGEYHYAVFAAQPAREGDGYTNAQLTGFAKTAGITEPALTTWQKCTDSGQHNQYVADVADASGRAGVTGTPTLMLKRQGHHQDPDVSGRPGRSHQGRQQLIASIPGPEQAIWFNRHSRRYVLLAAVTTLTPWDPPLTSDVIPFRKCRSWFRCCHR